MLLFDEAAGIPSKIWEVSEGFFTEKNPYRFWLAASQMRNRSGRFFELFNDKQIGHGWRARTLSTRGMDASTRRSSKIRSSATARLRLRARRDHGPAAAHVRRPVHPVGCGARRAANELVFRDYGEPLILGVDPAPRGKTAWRFRQGRNARDCCGAATHGSWLGKDNVQIAEAVLELDRSTSPTRSASTSAWAPASSTSSSASDARPRA
jgi:hypothetical protein